MGALTRRKIAELMRDELGYSLRVSQQLVDVLFRQMKISLLDGDPVKIVKFGTFRLVRKAARKGTSPATGESITIPPRRMVVFHPSRKLKGIINAEQRDEILSDRGSQQADRS
jgi:integration host factor subunit alpha